MSEELRAKDAELEELRAALRWDGLTGLRSKWAFWQRFPEELDSETGHAVNARAGGEAFFVLCDLDGFKGAQDAHPHGHAHGDAILREFGEWLASNTRDGDDGRASDAVAYRVGGDEFAVWVETRAGARRIRDAVRNWRSNTDPAVSASAGMGPDKLTADANTYANKLDRKGTR